MKLAKYRSEDINVYREDSAGIGTRHFYCNLFDVEKIYAMDNLRLKLVL